MAESQGVLGLKVLFEGPNPCVDIVAVHGLGATPDWAWISKVTNGGNVNWLGDKNMLPEKLPQSRIMTFNYESKWIFQGVSKQRRSLCAFELLTALDNRRIQEDNTKYRPLIFIGHSFGGIVIEQSIVSANAQDDFRYLALSTVGIVFLGTPHRGTPDARWGDVIAKTASVLGFESENAILKEFGENSDSLIDLLYDFSIWANKFSATIICFFEQHKTDYVKRLGIGFGWPGLDFDKVVSETSACIDGHRKVPLPTDHLKINKYSGPNDPSYDMVYPFVMRIAQSAVRKVQDRLNPRVIINDNSGIDKRYLDCLRSLFLSNPVDDLAAIRSLKGDRVPGTCEWILSQGPYTSWRQVEPSPQVESSPQLLWLSGGPGIGKTMISTFLTEELIELAQRSPRMTLAYYFCDDKDEKRNNSLAILRGLLLQIVRQRPTLFEYIQPDFEESGNNLFTNFHALWRIFVRILNEEAAGEVYCLIDALDECREDSRRLLLTDLRKLFSSQQGRMIPIKLIITSRRNSDISEALGEENQSPNNSAIRHLQIDSGQVNGDLKKFIDVRVTELSARKSYSRQLKADLKSTLIEKAGGTFLYVSLVLDDLDRTKIQSQVRQKLQKLPSDLNKLYDKILSQIEADFVEIAISVLRWVAVARRPLTVKELAMARILESGEWTESTEPSDDLLSETEDAYKCCEPFVEVGTDNTINLVHQSAKEFLLGRDLEENDSLSRYHIVSDRTNLLIFKTCWTYLSLEEFEKGSVIITIDEYHNLCECQISEKVLEAHCLLRYASEEWREHALAAGPVMATEFEFTKNDLHKIPTIRDTWLLRVAREGQEVIVRSLLERGAQLESHDNNGWTPLFMACLAGHEKVVTLLLEKGAPLEARDNDGRTPLFNTVLGGYEKVVILLLEKGALLESRDYNGRTPLFEAVLDEYGKIVTLLLEKGALLESRNKYGETPLFEAVLEGHEKVVTLLLEKGALLESRDKHGRTPLFKAAFRGHKKVVTLLLERGALLESRDIWGRTPLYEAVLGGNEKILTLLLERGALLDSQDNKGKTPLSWAISWRHEGIATLLLKRGAKPLPSQQRRRKTPLDEE